MGEKLNSSDSLYHDLILLSWVNIKKLNLTKSPSLLLRRIIISFLVKCDRMYLIRCNNEINDWACSAVFAWEDHRKPYELAQSSILLLGRLRHILSCLTRQEMTIRRKKSDGLFLLIIPLFGRILRCLSCSLQFAHCDQMVALYFLANILRSYLLGVLLKPQSYTTRNPLE